MELTGKKFNVPRVRGLPASRRGAVALAVGCAVAAAVILLIALSQYKQSVSLADRQESVLVATGTIEKGTSGDAIAQQQLYKPTPILVKNLAPGAVTNAATLTGDVAVQNILPGQQLTAADFTPSADSVAGELSPGQRAVSLTLDAQHGMVGVVEPGDHVDVYGAFSSPSLVKRLYTNALVLKVPSAGSAVGGAANAATVVLAVNDKDVGTTALTAEAGKIWLALRPGQATTNPQGLTTLNSVLFGTGGK